LALSQQAAQDAGSRLPSPAPSAGEAQECNDLTEGKVEVQMKTELTAVVVASGILLAAPGARAADGFGSAGTVAISAERLFGIVASSDTETIDGQPGEQTGYSTTVSLLSSPYGGLLSSYSYPRVGVDVFAIQGLSLGAALGYVTISTSSKAELNGASVETDGPTLNGFIFAPRVGYAYMFMDLLGIWPRAGITYVSAGSSDTNEMGDSVETSTNRLALTLEVPLVIAPSPHAAITVGPTLDLGLSGGAETTTTIDGVSVTTKRDHKATDIGLQAGLTIAF
jgi:hypothetical protein